MTVHTELGFPRSASLALIGGGLLMAACWLVFTYVHGPTSYDETRAVLGQSTLFWGWVLGGPATLLTTLGFVLAYRPRIAGARPRVRAGFWLTVAGLVIAGGLDLLVWRALGPPFFIPVVGVGLLLLGADRRMPGAWLLLGLGLALLIGFGLSLVPQPAFDTYAVYRPAGVFAYLLPGLGWAALATLHLTLRPYRLPSA